MTTHAYALTVMQHEATGHYIATCDILLPFIAQGSSLTELRENSRVIIRRILEKNGCVVESVEISPPAPEVPNSISVTEITAVAVYECAA